MFSFSVSQIDPNALGKVVDFTQLAASFLLNSTFRLPNSNIDIQSQIPCVLIRLQNRSLRSSGHCPHH